MRSFADGLTNVINRLANRRSAGASNVANATRVSDAELRELNKLGIASKIIRLKAAYALDDTLQFESDAAEKEYGATLRRPVSTAARYMLGFGRGVIVLAERDQDMSEPRTRPANLARTNLVPFSGDMVQGHMPDTDLTSARYMRPTQYMINGVTFHHTRVIDFTYVEPTHFEMPQYGYGGISELELIRDQIINDQVVERASGAILEKNSTVVHGVHGFKAALQAGQDDSIIEYHSRLADLRSIYGDMVVDAEDEVTSVGQSLSNLADVSKICLQRIAMVTGIPAPLLVGQAVDGLNSTGSQERQSFNDTISALREGYLISPINELMRAVGEPEVEFAPNKEGTRAEQMDLETQAIKNAGELFKMSEDNRAYLIDHGILQQEDLDGAFPEPEGSDNG